MDHSERMRSGPVWGCRQFDGEDPPASVVLKAGGELNPLLDT